MSLTGLSCEWKQEKQKQVDHDVWMMWYVRLTIFLGLQPTKMRAELDSSTVLKQIFYEYHPLKQYTLP